MPLLDHFHPPLTPARRWESFHSLWAGAIVARLNGSVLPAGYFAEAEVHVGGIEVDAASFESHGEGGSPAVRDGNGGVATYVPPAAALAMPAIYPDEVEVRVFEATAGATLVGAIELVSPGNKDRPEARRAFAAKCASYLHEGIGLVVVDVVTGRHANLHDELVRVLEQDDRYRFPGGATLYAVAYHPVRRNGTGGQIDLWPVPLALGEPLPTLPLALRGGPTVPVDLDATYAEARARSRL